MDRNEAAKSSLAARAPVLEQGRRARAGARWRGWGSWRGALRDAPGRVGASVEPGWDQTLTTLNPTQHETWQMQGLLPGDEGVLFKPQDVFSSLFLYSVIQRLRKLERSVSKYLIILGAQLGAPDSPFGALPAQPLYSE